jgi:hypothetical protein
MPNTPVRAAAEGMPALNRRKGASSVDDRLRERRCSMTAETQRLERIAERLGHIGSLVHGIWMAAGAVEGQPERDAIRDIAHHTGETLDDILAEVKRYSQAPAEKPAAKLVGGSRT